MHLLVFLFYFCKIQVRGAIPKARKLSNSYDSNDHNVYISDLRGIRIERAF